jgi:hypothetical protein
MVNNLVVVLLRHCKINNMNFQFGLSTLTKYFQQDIHPISPINYEQISTEHHLDSLRFKIPSMVKITLIFRITNAQISV